MKILIYSDLHLEFNNPFKPPENSDADLMILAGDIITFKDSKESLKKFLCNWYKPVLYIAGNHEYYGRIQMRDLKNHFKQFISENNFNIKWLQDESFSLDNIEFFGGTMWTDFNNSNPHSMMSAHRGMNDFREIFLTKEQRLFPDATVEMHEIFKTNLIDWLEKNKDKKRVVISHHAPVINPNSSHHGSKLQAAYNSLDMIPIIEKYQPELWIYGHTHESDDQMIGKTRIVSNPFGYYKYDENGEFKPELVIEL